MSLLLSRIQGYRRDRSFKIPHRTTALGDGDDDESNEILPLGSRELSMGIM